MSIPTLIGPSQWCACNTLHYDSFGDHFQERGDLEIKDYVVLQKPQEQDDPSDKHKEFG